MRRIAGLLLLIAVTVAASFGGEKENALFAAARSGDPAAVKAALASGADVNAKFRYGATALSYACNRDNVEVVRILLEAGADPNVKDTFYNATPMQWAFQNGQAEIVGLLLEKGATGADTLLPAAAQAGRLAVVKAILEKGKPSPAAQSQALDVALVSGNNPEIARARAEVAKFLTDAGIKPTPKPDVQIDPATLQKYAGTYRNDAGNELIFTLKDGKLSGGPAGQNAFEFFPTDPVTFNVSGAPGVSAKFNLEADKVVSLTLRQGENSTLYKRVEK